MASVIDILIKANTSKASGDMKKFGGTLDEILRGLTGFSMKGLGAAGVVVGIGNAIKDSTEKFIAYGKAMTEMAAITGTGVEETSRLVQTMDDFGITQEKLNTILQQAAKKGFVMTVDSVARLADEYNSLETQEERNALMTERLGRAGLDLNKVMESGSAVIREYAAAQSEALILTAEEAARAEELRLAIDAANDTFEGYSLTLGGAVAQAYNKATEASLAHARSVEENRRAHNENYRAQQESKEAGLALVNMYSAATEGIAGYSGALENSIGPLQAVQDATYAVTDVLKSYNDQLLFTIASEGLSADEAMNLATRMGLVDQNTQAAYQKTAEWKAQLDAGIITVAEYQAKILGLQAAIASLKDRTVTVTMNLEYAGGANSNLGGNVLPSGYTDYQQRASGGPVNYGQPYIVGEQGPELFVPQSNGAIVPNNQVGGVTINTLNISLPGVTNAQQFMAELGKLSRRGAAAGMAYAGG